MRRVMHTSMRTIAMSDQRSNTCTCLKECLAGLLATDVHMSGKHGWAYALRPPERCSASFT